MNPEHPSIDRLLARGLSRRDALRIGAASAVGALAAPLLGQQPRLISKLRPLPDDVFMTLNMAPAQLPIFDGAMTDVWRYTASLQEGPASTLAPMANSYLGPILRFRTGQRVSIAMRNQLPEATITHWHGLHVPDVADGHPRFAVGPGETYNYNFTVANRAGVYWYHPHPDMTTGMQVNAGLAGLIYVTDPREQALPLPKGVYDVPVVIQDRTINSNNQFSYAMGGLAGFLGTRILINGQPDYVKYCGQRCYRVRILNACNTRIMKLAWSDGSPMLLIGTDGGLIDRTTAKPYIMLSPGERVEVWADFRNKAVGTDIKLRSLSFNPYLGQGGVLSHGSTYDVCTFSMAYSGGIENLSPPPVLTPLARERVEDATNADNPRVWNMDLSPAPRRWRLNGALFDMEGVSENEVVPKGKLEVVELYNPTGSIQMPHPIHLHGRQFLVIERTLLAGSVADYENVKQGFTDEGYKDTVLIWPGERVRILVRWPEFPGLFNWHCHILEHEDMGMMRNFRVE